MMYSLFCAREPETVSLLRVDPQNLFSVGGTITSKVELMVGVSAPEVEVRRS